MPDNLGILWSSEEHSIGKGRRRNPICVSSQCSHQNFTLNIVDLNFSLGKTDGQVVALRVEGKWANILIILFLNKLPDASRSIEIDLIVQANRKRPSAAPVQEVQIVVVSNFRCVEHLLRRQVDVLLHRLLQHLFVLLRQELLNSRHAVSLKGVLAVLTQHGLGKDLLR